MEILKYLSLSSLFQTSPCLEQIASSSVWEESGGLLRLRFLTCTRETRLVEHRKEIQPSRYFRLTLCTPWVNRAGGSDAGWWRPCPGSPSLCASASSHWNSSEVCFPLVSLIVSKLLVFFSQKSKGLAASTLQYHYTYILRIHRSLPMFFPLVPLLTNLSIA